MPQIGNLVLADNLAASPMFTTEPISTIPSKEAKWAETSYPELGRTYVDYAFRKADATTGLVRHSFKVTFPTLKSVVTDPSGPYAPPPQLDYVTVAELHLFVHPRSTAAEREAAVSVFLRSDAGSSSLRTLLLAVTAGQTVY